MSANLIALAVADHDEISELKARVACLEEAIADVRRNIIVLRNQACDIEESLLARKAQA